jgi:hypothetical protein
MKKVFIKMLAIFFSTVLLNCFGDANPLTDTKLLEKYPLSKGNYWNYHRTFQFPNLPAGAFVHSMTDTIISEYYTVECLGKESLVGLFNTFLLIVKSNDSIQTVPTIWGKSYYANEKDGLYLYGYTGNSLSMPKNARPTIKFKETYYQNIDNLLSQLSIDPFFPGLKSLDSLYLEIPPVKILEYPMRTNAFWIMRESGAPSPYKIAKKILGHRLVTVKAGIFNAYQVNFLYDMDGDGEWEKDISMVDDYADIGLVRRTFVIKDVKLIDEFGNVIGIFDLWDKYELINYQVYM